jgi:ATP-dependent helicase HrpA
VLRTISDSDDPGLLQTLRRELQRIGNEPIPVDAFDLDSLPAHLRPTFRIVDDAGNTVVEGRDLRVLKDEVRAETAATVVATAHGLETTGLSGWSIGELPHIVAVSGTDHTVDAYPALVDERNSVGVRLLATRDEQAGAMWQGTIRLLLLNLPSPGKVLRPMLDRDARAALRVGPHADQTEWVDDCLGCALGEIITRAGGPAWDATAFDRLLARARDELHPLVTRVAAGSLDLLAVLEEAEIAFNRLDEEHNGAVIDDIANQVASLVYPGFLTRIGSDRIADVTRYLEAIIVRIDRLKSDPVRDAANMALIHDLEAELDRIAAGLPGDPRLMDAAWMIQELRVSLFAQILGTRAKVSEVRVRRFLDEIEMG